MKSIYTTGDVARICRIGQLTVIRCFESGRLKGYKIPGSKHRRITRGDLRVFMKEHQIPLEWIDEYDKICGGGGARNNTNQQLPKTQQTGN